MSATVPLILGPLASRDLATASALWRAVVEEITQWCDAYDIPIGSPAYWELCSRAGQRLQAMRLTGGQK